MYLFVYVDCTCNDFCEYALNLYPCDGNGILFVLMVKHFLVSHNIDFDVQVQVSREFSQY